MDFDSSRINQSQLQFQADVSNLKCGVYQLFIRVQDTLGKWSVPTSQKIFIAQAPNKPIKGFSYFFDNDPGIGKGAINFFAEQVGDIDKSILIPLEGLTPGMHALGYRLIDGDNNWSPTQVEYFLLHDNQDSLKINKLIYFIDNSPSSRSEVELNYSSDNSVVPFTIDISGLSKGFHSLFVQVVDEKDNVSHVFQSLFYVFPEKTIALQELEYFIDGDPTFDKGIPITVEQNLRTINEAFFINVDTLEAGNHILFFRMKDADGVKGHLSNFNFSILGPFSPKKLIASPISTKDIRLDWDDKSDNENGFIIERKSSGTNFSEIARVEQDITAYVDGNLNLGASYEYRIRSFNDEAISRYSNVAEASPALLPPDSLNVLKENAKKILLSWRDNSFEEVRYSIERLEVGISQYKLLGFLDRNSVSYLDTTVFVGKTYCYRVQARTNIFFSTFSDTACIKIDVEPPLNLQASAVTTSQIRLDWEENETYETGFYLERSVNNETSFELIEVLPPNSTFFLDSALDKNDTYFYRIRSFIDTVVSVYSNTASASPAIPAPSSLTISSLNSRDLLLSWEDNSIDEVNFILERAIGVARNFREIAKPSEDQNTIVDRDLFTFSTYYYRIKAIGLDAESGYSNEAAIRLELLSPTSLSIDSVSNMVVSLKWVNRSSDEVSVLLERTNGLSTTFSLIAELPQGTSQYLDQDIIQGRIYKYRVRVVNEIPAFSNFSNEVEVDIPVVTTPSNFQVEKIHYRQITLSWTNNSLDTERFVLDRSTDPSFAENLLSRSISSEFRSFNDSLLYHGIRYYYRLSNQTMNGISDYSNTVSAQTPRVDFTANPLQINAGETVNFRDISEGDPVSWEWLFPGGTPASSNEQRPVVTYQSGAGFYDVGFKVIGEEGDTGDTLKTALIEVRCPEFTPIILVDRYFLTSTVGAKYKWFFDGEQLTDTTRTIEALEVGQYRVEVTDPVGCIGLSDPINVTVTGLGENKLHDGIKIFPNPNEGRFLVELPQVWKVEKLAIQDILGKEVGNVSIRNLGNSQWEIGLYEGVKGIYIISVYLEEGVYYQKVMIE